MKRKILSVLLAVSLSLAGCVSASAADDYVMQMNLSSVMCSAPISIAHILGYFNEEGLKYKMERVGNQFEAVMADRLDIIYTLLPTIVQRMASGFEMSVVYGVHYGCINMIAPKSSGFKDISDLRGKKIGVPGMGTSPHIMLQRVLKAYDIGSTPDKMDVSVLAFDDTVLPAAMERGEIDAMMTWDPFATQVAENDDSVMMLYEQAKHPSTKDEYCCLVALRSGFLREHPESAAKYSRAISRACDYIAAHPKEAAKLIIDNDMCPVDDVDFTARLLDSYRYKVDVQGGKDSFLACTRDLAELGIIELRETPEEFTEKAFAPVPGF